MIKIDKKLNPDYIAITDYEKEDNSGYLPIALWKICEIDFKQEYYFTNFIELKISNGAEYGDQAIIPLNSKCIKIYTGAVKNPGTLIKQVLIKC